MPLSSVFIVSGSRKLSFSESVQIEDENLEDGKQEKDDFDFEFDEEA